jgi:hypothetical protein
MKAAAQNICLVQQVWKVPLEETGTSLDFILSPLRQAIELDPVALEHYLKLRIRQVTLQTQSNVTM